MVFSRIHSNADDSILHYFFQFERRPFQQQLIDSRKMALEQLTSDLSRISNLPHNYDFFENTQLKPSSVLDILVVSFSRDLSWKDHIISLSKQASKSLVF